MGALTVVILREVAIVRTVWLTHTRPMPLQQLLQKATGKTSTTNQLQTEMDALQSSEEGKLTKQWPRG